MYHFRKNNRITNKSLVYASCYAICLHFNWAGWNICLCTAYILQRAYRMAYANRATFVPINWNLSFYKQYNTWSFIKTSQKAYNRPRARTHTRYYLSRAIKQNVNFTIMLWICCFNFSRTYIQRTKGEWCLYYKVQFLFKFSVVGFMQKRHVIGLFTKRQVRQIEYYCAREFPFCSIGTVCVWKSTYYNVIFSLLVFDGLVFKLEKILWLSQEDISRSIRFHSFRTEFR